MLLDPLPRWSRARLAARAVRHKVRAVGALGTFWPAVVRGGELLARGRVREFAGKLFNETATVRAADAAPVRPGPPLLLAGHILRPGGYDTVVRALLEGLIGAGVNVVRDADSVVRPDLIAPHLRPSEARPSTPAPRLVATPPHLLARFRPDRRTAAVTMWETDTLPPAAVAALNRCGLVVVPTRWGADCFRANGVTAPVEVVPLGYDPGVFSAEPNPLTSFPGKEGGVKGEPPRSRGGFPGVRSPLRFGEGPGEGLFAPALCVFGTAGALDEGGLRKNVQRVVDVFRRAFPADAGVRLRVKISPTSPPVRTHGDPRIDVTRESLPPADLADWYRSLTAFVNGSFGEGFGLHLLEAMACGRPLISTTFGGAGAFFDGAVGYDVGYRLVEARNAVYAGRWADPDDGHMIRRMRDVRHDPADAARRGALAADRARGFTWGGAVQKLLDVLARHGFVGKPAA